MTVPEALRVDTDGGIKPDMASIWLLQAVGNQPLFPVALLFGYNFLRNADGVMTSVFKIDFKSSR
jgi:hypothetical protein